MGEPLVVSIHAADPSRAKEFAEALQKELARRGADPAEVRIEIERGAALPEGIVVEAGAGASQAAAEVLARLRDRSGAGEPPGSGAAGQKSPAYTAEEEEEVRRRLEDLGYY